MLRPNIEAPWLALIAFVLFSWFAYLMVNPFPRWRPQLPSAARPVVRFELPPVPALTMPAPHTVHPGLSLADVTA